VSFCTIGSAQTGARWAVVPALTHEVKSRKAKVWTVADRLGSIAMPLHIQLGSTDPKADKGASRVTIRRPRSEILRRVWRRPRRLGGKYRGDLVLPRLHVERLDDVVVDTGLLRRDLVLSLGF